MENTEFHPQTAVTKETLAGILDESPALKQLILPTPNPESRINDTKVRRIYTQAALQQWFAPRKIDFDADISYLDPEVRRVLIKINIIFYTLEKMGLDVIQFMMPKAVTRLKSNEAAMYLSAQCFDEARHVWVIENYLRKLGSLPEVKPVYLKLGRLASNGVNRVENWLFSTLFSENFASAFLRQLRNNSEVDPIGQAMAKSLLQDESRHLMFLHSVLPDLFDRLSIFGRSYLKVSQYFIMSLTERFCRTLEEDVKVLGIDKRALIEEVFTDIERAYESFGVSREFLYFPKITGSPIRSH